MARTGGGIGAGGGISVKDVVVEVREEEERVVEVLRGTPLKLLVIVMLVSAEPALCRRPLRRDGDCEE